MKINKPSVKKSILVVAGAALIITVFVNCKKDNKSNTDSGINQVNHVVVIYMENHSFDNLYGSFAGANGLANATAANTTQVDANGNPYQYLPPVTGSSTFPTNLPNTYFNIDQYVSNDQLTPDVLHRYYQEQMQIDGGKMDKFALYNANSAGLSQGYYKTDLLPLVAMAKKYVLCDNFFHSAFGGSFLNHQWLIAAASPTFPNAPASITAKVDANGNVITDGLVTPDGYVVNTSYSVNAPHPASVNASVLVPNQTNPTIGDRLSEKNVSWAWYSGGWNDALAGNPDPTFQFHHQPFIYFKNFADGTQAKKDHLKDETDFIAAAKAGNLPAVSFVKPLGKYNEHPGYSDVALGENHALELVNDVLNGPNGKDAVIIITYDEHGGFWDHVNPPVIDKKWGPGLRVPAIIISPFAKQGYVDHTQYETVGILSFIEKRWGLAPLSDRDKNAAPLTNAFNFK
ncbi:alkaline phosphatase family protein [Mucilaginibacter sp. KACC 22063]|uniref:alkaline phosphatase family protein n=1 Tax=Mucilaginibacter sp. KACC 22063 TaxID=3025666 RepID=UPI002366B23A|nr:alkaline phosphatase family protein [Mucilaginibacter sp. KACC 22063]WDF56694.1 alkaline phosphatase family protein [Mucilaginibacter sp. KACC 22063]